MSSKPSNSKESPKTSLLPPEKTKFAEDQAVIINAEKEKADEALMEALPAVEAASAALANLDKNDLTELKAFTNPPPAVKSLCMQLCCLRPTGTKYEETWNDAKKLLSESSLLANLKGYAKDDITVINDNARKSKNVLYFIKLIHPKERKVTTNNTNASLRCKDAKSMNKPQEQYKKMNL